MRAYTGQITGLCLIILIRRALIYAVQFIPAHVICEELIRTVISALTLIFLALWCRSCGTSLRGLWNPGKAVNKNSISDITAPEPENTENSERIRSSKFSETLLLSLLGIAVCAAAFIAISAIFSEMPEFAADKALQSPDKSTAAILMMLLSKVIITPATEELLYRGAVLHALTPLGKYGAVFISAAVFAAVHPSPPSMLYAFIFGIVFASISLKTKTLLPAAAAHAINNLAALICYVL